MADIRSDKEREHREGVETTEQRKPQRLPVWLVAMPQGGLFGVYLDRGRADQAARNIQGVLVQLPTVADYRKAEG